MSYNRENLHLFDLHCYSEMSRFTSQEWQKSQMSFRDIICLIITAGVITLNWALNANLTLAIWQG